MKTLTRKRPKEAAAPPPDRGKLPFRAVREHLILADDGVWAVFQLRQQPYTFAHVEDQESLAKSARQRWAELAGFRVQERMLAHPFPHGAWARALHQAYPASRRLRESDEHGAETWDEYLAASQRAAALVRCRTPVTYLLVRFSTRRFDPTSLRVILGDQPTSPEITKARASLRKVTNIVAGPGFEGRPATTRSIAWLTHMSVAPGVPAPNVAIGDVEITSYDLGVFTSPVRVESEPYAPYARVHAMRDGKAVTKYVTVLSMGRNTHKPIAGGIGWLAFTRTFDFPVEVTTTLDVYHGDVLIDGAEARRTTLLDQQDYFLEIGDEPSAEAAGALDDARRIVNDVASGPPEVANRAYGPVRVAISTDTPEKLETRVQEFISTMQREQQIEWVHPQGQQALLTEFHPCAGPATPGLQQRLTPGYLAAATPNAATSIGTPSGPLLGVGIGGSGEAFLFDPTWGPRHNLSGAVLLASTQGKGKSTTTGLIVENAVRIGHQGYLFDPSSQLWRLAEEVPHLRKDARIINLAEAAQGTLNPHSLVPTPRIEDFPGAAEGVALWGMTGAGPKIDGLPPELRERARARRAYLQAIASAEAERREYAIDAITSLLPKALLTGPNGGDYQAVIRAAASTAPADYGTPLWDVLDALRADGNFGHSAAKSAESMQGITGASLLFPDRDGGGDDLPTDAALTIFTFPGLAAPPAGTDPAHWTISQQVAGTVLSMGSRYVGKAMYAPGPKVIANDEAALSSAGQSSMPAFLDRTARDSRKHETCAILASQNVSDVFPITPEIANLIGVVFIGGMKTRASAAAALTLAGVPTGVGFEDTILNLDSGQFLVRDWEHKAPQLVQVLIDHRPVMAAALNTTPNREHDESFDHRAVHA